MKVPSSGDRGGLAMRWHVETWELPLRVDGEASLVTGEGIVVDRVGKIVATGGTVDEAFAAVARINGTTEEEEMARARALCDYLGNLRRRRVRR